MHDIYDLLELVKEVAIKAVKTEEPVEIQYGTVKCLDPFTIDMGGYTLEDDFLILTRTIRGLLDRAALHVGDAVVLLKDAGGEDWLVLDAVEVEDGD